MTNVFKKFGMAIVAILMVVGFSAFKASEKENSKKSINLEVWYFNGSNNGSLNTPSEYSKSQPNLCGSTKQTICEVNVPTDPITGLPDLDAHLDPDDINSPTYEEMIEEALYSGAENEVVRSFRPF